MKNRSLATYPPYKICNKISKYHKIKTSHFHTFKPHIPSAHYFPFPFFSLSSPLRVGISLSHILLMKSTRISPVRRSYQNKFNAAMLKKNNVDGSSGMRKSLKGKMNASVQRSTGGTLYKDKRTKG